MPQVPDQFVPSATTSPLGVSAVSAQPVQAMRNAAPGQMQEAGAATQKLGEVASDIGERIQNQLDNAMAKQAETGFLQSVMNITAGDGTAANPGYLNLRGQAAINGYQDAATAIAKAKQDGQAGLADDFQKSMYNRVATQHLVSFGRQMADHRFQQTAQYSGESAINRANASATGAVNAYASYGQTDIHGNTTGDFQRNLAVAEQETLAGVAVMKGAPAGSDIANAALLNLHTQVGIGTLSQMMDAKAPYSKVQGIYEDMKAKGFLTIQAQDTLGKMVKNYTDSESNQTVVAQSLSDAVRASQKLATSSTGTPDYQFPIKGGTTTAQPYVASDGKTPGGVTVNIPPGSSIQAPASGKVTQVGRDAADNFSLKIQHPDGSVTAFTGLTASNVKVGDQVERGENVASSGTADGKTPSVLWSLTNAAGTNVDPTKAGLAQVDPSKITDENVLHDALDRIRAQITDPVQQHLATNEAEAIVKVNQRNQQAGQAQLYKQASDAFYPNWNARDIPPSVFGQLTPEQQADFKNKQTEHVLQQYHQGQAFKEMGETDIVSDFISNPSILTPANVDAARPNLANSTYLQLMGKATEMQNNPKGVIEAQAVKDRVDYFAEHSGMNVSGFKRNDDGSVVSAKRTADDKDNYNALTFKVQSDIDQIKAQNHGKATAEQVDKAIQQELIRRTTSTPRSWPMSMFGPSSKQTYDFQRPLGATQVVPGSDGTSHYFDANGKDLGAVK